jgi:hypothetical protein
MAMFLGEEVQNSCRYFFIDRAAGMFGYLGIGHFETEDHSISSSFLIIGIWKALMIVDYETSVLFKIYLGEISINS